MLIADRLEGDRVVCEQNGIRTLALPRALVRGPVREGDVLSPLEAGYFGVDADATALRRAAARKRRARLRTPL